MKILPNDMKILPNGMDISKRKSERNVYVSLNRHLIISYCDNYPIGVTNVITSEQWIIGDYWDSVFSTE